MKIIDFVEEIIDQGNIKSMTNLRNLLPCPPTSLPGSIIPFDFDEAIEAKELLTDAIKKFRSRR